MIKVHVMWRGMWRCVYVADAWSMCAHLLALGATATVGIGLWRALC